MLIFKNLDDSHPLPDVHITLEPDNGPMCEWFPDVDEYDALSIPGYPENPILLDFAIWGDVTGLDGVPRGHPVGSAHSLGAGLHQLVL